MDLKYGSRSAKVTLNACTAAAIYKTRIIDCSSKEVNRNQVKQSDMKNAVKKVELF